jgi:hypothetical protein
MFLIQQGTVLMVVIVWELDLPLPIQSVHVTIKDESSNPIHGEVYSIQNFVIVYQGLAAGQWISDAYSSFPHQ